MANTIERKVYANSANELRNQTNNYRKAKPVSNDLGIYTNRKGYSLEYLRSAPKGTIAHADGICADGYIAMGSVDVDDAGQRPAFNLIYDPTKSPREARDPTAEEIEKYGKNIKGKKLLDIPRSGTTITVQIDNFDAIQGGTAKTYEVKTLPSVKAQRFNKYEDGTVCNDYENSELDQACCDFYDTLSPEIQAQIPFVVMDKDKNYDITEVKIDEVMKTQKSPKKLGKTVGVFFPGTEIIDLSSLLNKGITRMRD